MHTVKKEYYEDGTVRKVVPYNGDLIDGMVEFYHRNGRLRCCYTLSMGHVQDCVMPIMDEDGNVFRIDVWENERCSVYNEKHQLLGHFSSFNDASNGDEEWFYEDGTLKETAFCVNGKYDGSRKRYFPNGNLAEEAIFVDDKLEGFVTRYYVSGAVRIKIPYVHDKVEGVGYTYAESGEVIRKSVYEGGYLNGEDIYYFNDGTVRCKQFYKNNLLHGKCCFYHPNGQIYKVMNYEEGKVVDGEVVLYNDDDSIVEVETWKDNVCSLYHANGKPRLKIPYVNGRRQGQCKTYYENGQLMRTCFLDDGSKEGSELFFNEDGSLMAVTPYVNNRIEGIRMYYHDNGSIHVEEERHNDLKNGTTRIYDEDGKLRQTILFVDDSECGRKWYRYHENGKLDAETEIVNGMPNGTELCYNDDGSLASEMHFKDGMVSDEENDVFNPGGELYMHLFWKNNVARAYYESGALKHKSHYYRSQANGLYQNFNEDGSVDAEYYFLDGNACHDKDDFLKCTFLMLAYKCFDYFAELGSKLEVSQYDDFFKSCYEELMNSPEAKVTYDDYSEIVDIPNDVELTQEQFIQKIAREFFLRLRLPNDGLSEMNFIDSLQDFVRGE